MGTIIVKKDARRIAYLDSEMYVTRPVRYSCIPVEEIISHAAQMAGMTRSNVSAAFYAIAQQIEVWVCNGHSIQLGNLGTLYLSANSHAEEDEKDAGAKSIYRMSVQFRQSKRLQEHLNSNIRLVNENDPQQGTAAPGQETEGTGSADGQAGE